MSSFLAPQDGTGSPLTNEYLGAMRLLRIQETDQSKLLDAYDAFCACTQHDHHKANWDGVPRDPGVGYMHERLRPQGFVPVNSVPSVARKPSAAVPLATQIVSRFTEMLLGQGRRPAIHVDVDEDTQAYLEALFGSAEIWETLASARDAAGACGASLIACSLVGGQPTAEVLHPRDCWVLEWDPSSPGWRPKSVVEQRQVEILAPDPETGKLETVCAWRTRAWTDTQVIYWPDVPDKDAQEDVAWPAPSKVIEHKLEVCPVVWLQNTRSTATPEGRPDCDGCWQLLDQVDRLESRICKAVSANVSPQLILKESERHRRRNPVIQRGVNSVISLTPEGDASYLEMSGDGIKVAQLEVANLIDQILQTAECVIVRPEHAKADQSGEALQILWRAMESRANRLRVQLEGAVRDLARIWVRWGRTTPVTSLEDWDWVGPPKGLMLPPKKVVTPPEPSEPEELGEEPAKPASPPEPTVRWTAHTVGKGSYVRCEWPPYWQPTASQVKTVAEGLSKASGGKPFLTTETSTRVFAGYLGQDPETEVAALAAQKLEAEAKMASFMSGPAEPDEGGSAEEPAEPGPAKPGQPDTEEPAAKPEKPAKAEG